MKIFKKALYYAVFAAAAYLLLKTTTYGWIFSFKPPAPPQFSVETAQRLKSHVTRLAVDIGPRDVFGNNRKRLELSKKYLVSELERYGYTPEFQEYPAGGAKAVNIIASKKGSVTPEEVIVVGAHYDSCDNPGADDNASGTAGVLELARRFAGLKPARSVRFVLFANEEPPFFAKEGMGSYVYAAEAAKKGENIKTAVVLEMIGFYADGKFSQKYPPLVGFFYPNRGNFIALVSNFASRVPALEAKKSFKKASGLPVEATILPAKVPGVDFSDHRSFWKFGWPAFMFTDTAFYRNSNYHKPTDLPETLDYGRMAACVEGIAAAVSDLAGR
ncbi:MAG: aminopeptidase [Elusimicrobia bacterium CG08_land_8_20_14_0_20_51_18]|nr:MAG: aminopeptidase [Elusimicrobia bacterium CG08_land_8_20_14_0_20_51_18]